MPASAELSPLGEPFSIDVAPDCQERDPDAASLPGGGFVAVWVASDAGAPGLGRVYARIYDADRNPVTPEFRVSNSGTGQDWPAVAAGSDGRFMVVWRDSTDQIRGRVFEASGAPASAEVVVGILFQQEFAEKPDVAASPLFGGFAVAWNDEGFILVRRFEEDGQPIDPDPIVVASHDSAVLGPQVSVSRPAITGISANDYFVAYSVQQTGPGAESSSRILARRIPEFPGPDEWPPLLELYTLEGGLIWGVDIGQGHGAIVVAWRQDGPAPGRHELYAQAFFVDGRRRVDRTRVDDRSWSRLGDPKLLLTDPELGSILVAWSGLDTDIISAGATRNTVWARLFDFVLRPQGASREVSPAGEVHRENPALAWADEREAVAVWQDGSTPPPTGPAGCFSAGISARGISTGCLPGPFRLCLGDGRFQLEATYPTGLPDLPGPGNAVPLTRDTGYFWFFDLENVELMVKVLDGRAINGRFWVFYGSLSDVAWELTVTDLVTGAAKTYSNPAGRLASRGDTGALPGGDPGSAGDDVVVQRFDAVSLDREALPAPWWEARLELSPPPQAALAPSHTPGGSAAGPCTDPALPVERRPGLCLNDERFEVEATWHDPFGSGQGGQGTGQGVPLTDDSGYFWFFDPANVELVVKVLDGRAVNGKFWVFYGALTNVEYDIRVRHFTGAEKAYHNPPFRFRSRADTGAFTPTCNCTLPPSGPVCGKDFVTYPSACDALCTGWVEVARTGPCF